MLSEALDAACVQKGARKKITWEERARVLDLSIVTVRRIVRRQGVDRSTLLAAFRSLSLEWKDSYCEYAKSSPEEGESHSSETASLELPAPRPRRLPKFAFTAAAALLLALGAFVMSPKKGQSGHTAEEEFAQQLIDRATDDYNAAWYDSARVKIAQAEDIARRHQNAPVLVNAELIEAKLAVEQGDYPRAVKCYTDALNTHRMLGEPQKIPALREDLAEVQVRQGDLAGARHSLVEAAKGFEALGDGVGVLMCERDLGSVAAQARDLRDANCRFQRALAMAEKSHKPDFTADIRLRQALVLRDEGRFDDARNLTDLALAYWKSKGHPRWIARCLLNRGTIEAAAGNASAAQSLLQESRAMYQQVGDQPGKGECEAWLTRLKTSRPEHSPARLASSSVAPGPS